MDVRAGWRRLEGSRGGRAALVGLGLFCLALAPLIAPLPGPGGLPLIVLGLTLTLRYATWTKRIYVRAKRRWPRGGDWLDRGLRRASAKRRRQLDGAGATRD